MSLPSTRASINWADDEEDNFDLDSWKAKADFSGSSAEELGPLQLPPTDCGNITVIKVIQGSNTTTNTKSLQAQPNKATTPLPFCEDHAHYFSSDPTDWGVDAPLAADLFISLNYIDPLPAYPEMSSDENGIVTWARTRYAANWRDMKVSLDRRTDRPTQYKMSPLYHVVRCYEVEDVEGGPILTAATSVTQDDDVESDANSAFVRDMDDVEGVNVKNGSCISAEEGLEEDVCSHPFTSKKLSGGLLQDLKVDLTVTDSVDPKPDTEYIVFEAEESRSSAEIPDEDAERKSLPVLEHITCDESKNSAKNTVHSGNASKSAEPSAIFENDSDLQHTLHSLFTESPRLHPTPFLTESPAPIPQSPTTAVQEPEDLTVSHRIAAEFCRLYDVVQESKSSMRVTSQLCLSLDVPRAPWNSPSRSNISQGFFVPEDVPVFKDLSSPAIGVGCFCVRPIRWRRLVARAAGKARAVVEELKMMRTGKGKRPVSRVFRDRLR